MSYDRVVLRRSSLAFAVVAFTVVACSSLPELTFDDGDAGGSEGGGGEGGGGGDGGVDAKPDTAGCVKTGAEICDDGIDNDCNGTADCADPACGAGSRVSRLRSGRLGARRVRRDAPPACPVSYTPTDLKVLNGAGDGHVPVLSAAWQRRAPGRTCAGATTGIGAGRRRRVHGGARRSQPSTATRAPRAP